MKSLDIKTLLFIVGSLLFIYAYHDSLEFRPTLYDDPNYLQNRTNTFSSSSYWSSLLFEPVINLWHPLTVFSHDCLSLIDQKAPWIHHFTNGLIHICNAYLLFFWIKKISNESLLATSSALIWLLHPVVVESTTWVSGRKDLLCLFFVLSTLIVATLERRYWITIVLATLAILAKPTAVMLPFVLIIQDNALTKTTLWNRTSLFDSVKRHLLVLTLSFLTLSLTIYFQTKGGQSIVDPRNFLERETGAAWALLHSIKHWIWPQNLHIAYPDPTNLTVLYTISGFIIFGISTYIITSRKAPALIRICLGLFLLFLFPTLGFVRAGNSLLADRYLYTSGIGLTVLLLYPLVKYPKLLISFTFITIVTFSHLTWLQRQHWRSTEALFKRVVSLKPKHPEALAQLAILEKQKGNHTKAKEMFKKSFEKNSENPIAHLHLGIYSIEDDNRQKAYEHFSAIVAFRGRELWLHENLAKLAWELDQKTTATKHLQDALQLANTKTEKARITQLIQKLNLE